MYYCIEGNPIPLARGRIGHGARRIYDSQRDLKIITGINLQNQHGDQPIYHGPLHLDITFYLKMPKLSMRKSLMVANTYHPHKPDISNLIKWVEDVANTIIYHDDAQIASITSRKIYNENPRTEFTIIPLLKEQKYENHPTYHEAQASYKQ